MPLTAGMGFPANKNWGSQSPPARAGLRGCQAWWQPKGQARSFFSVIYPIYPTLLSTSHFLLLPCLPASPLPPIPGKYLPSSLPTFEPPQASRPCSWHLRQEALSDCGRPSQSLFPPRNSQSPNAEPGIIPQFSSPSSLIPSRVPSPVLCSMGQGKRHSD